MGRRPTMSTVEDQQPRRGTPFTPDEVSLLVNEVKQRKSIIFCDGDRLPRLQANQVKQAWEEISEMISSLSGIQRSADQCRKRFNDMKRRGKINLFGRKRGRPPKNPTKTGVQKESKRRSPKRAGNQWIWIPGRIWNTGSGIDFHDLSSVKSEEQSYALSESIEQKSAPFPVQAYISHKSAWATEAQGLEHSSNYQTDRAPIEDDPDYEPSPRNETP
ncbi:hypothetical protein WMY93_003157 [Mugilogobius chulae]|uniref:Myb/SANT-like DNA-binding domain-containing protein n=1 Tax=Mugilogobius chulae TaxID=88201 RepID=A0AAW0QAX5_9GOBI